MAGKRGRITGAELKDATGVGISDPTAIRGQRPLWGRESHLLD